jgi:lipid-binding SYLF domain-containing protein
MNEDSLNSLLKDEFEIGNEGKTAAGPIGRVAAGSTDARIDAGILSYSRSKSLFSGAVLRRTVISPNDGLNEAIYQLKASKLLTSFSGHGKLPADLRLLPQTLARYSRR